jgi:hypothetical protein
MYFTTCFRHFPVVKHSIPSNFLTIIFFMSIIISLNCATMSHYDPTSYKTATDLKAESLLLIQKATEPPGPYSVAIESLRVRLQQALEYEKGKGTPNSITVRQWEILLDPKGNLLEGFLRKWQADNKGYSEIFIEGVSKNVSDAFDEIIKLERHKVMK